MKKRNKRKGHNNVAGLINLIKNLFQVPIIVAIPFAIFIGILGVMLLFLDLFV